MRHRFSRSVFIILVASVLVLLLGASSAWAQQGTQGTVTVIVFDPTGGVVPDAQLELRDLTTNDVRRATTQQSGTYTFVNLSLGTYKLTVSKTGFQTSVYDAIVVQAARVTDLNVTLKVGAVSETVEVSGGVAPLVETTTNAIGATIDLKSIENLPIQGRDLTQLAQYVPGYTGAPGNGQAGTWNGLPTPAQASNVDGVIGNSTRMKFTGNGAQPAISPRLEDIQEMTVQTNQMDMNQGFGAGNMQVNFVTRRGSNAFHGRVFEDHRNSALNANSWSNNNAGVPKNKFHLNDFGASVGGPILKDKLFFFGSYSESKRPGQIDASNTFIAQSAQDGTFTYAGTDGNNHTVNLLTIAENAGYPSVVNSQILQQFQLMNTNLSSGSVTHTSDPAADQVNWLVPGPDTWYYPTVRIDYNASEKVRLNLAWNESKRVQPSSSAIPPLPGPDFVNRTAGHKSNAYTTVFGVDWTLSPTLVNSLRAGFLYTYNAWSYNSAPLYVDNPTVDFGGEWGTSGMDYQALPPVSSFYPNLSLSDTLTWQHRAHTFNFGFAWRREQDHYWNPPEGYPIILLGLSGGDPANSMFTTGAGGTLPYGDNALTEAQDLYAALVGRISSVAGRFAYNPQLKRYLNVGDPNRGVGAFNLDELSKSWGIFFQDSYRLRPNLTINYGLRWDFTGDNYDLTGAYHSASPKAIFGPSGINNVFNPGSLVGDLNPVIESRPHAYHPWNVSPQPSLGVAWNPHFKNEGFLGKLTGGDNTVIRAGYALRRWTPPQQYYWNQATDFGAFYYQNYYLNPNTSGDPGTFQPGSLNLDNVGAALPGVGKAPAAYQVTAPESLFTFLAGTGVGGLDPNIHQPYTMSWNLGIQRQLGNTRALEISYVGNRSLHQWILVDINEVNIFENGFLDQFKQAQQNLAINQSNGITSFADLGYAGQVATPIFDAAFAGEGLGADGSLSDYTNSNFISFVSHGAAGSLANSLNSVNGTAPYLCNLVGVSFTPCATNAGYTGAGAGYPINFFTANPYATDTGNNYTGIPGVPYLVSGGWSTYNALQMDFRQRQWHGVQFDANYTWSHTLGVSSANDWTGAVSNFTLRNMRLGYGPTLYDIRHVAHVNATYDLPFGRGKQFLNQSGVVDKIVGGWTVGTVLTLQTGRPFRLQGGRRTFNDLADGGVVLNGVSISDLQNSIGVYRLKSSQTTGGQSVSYVDIVNPKYLASPNGGGANTTYLTSNTTPGTIIHPIYLYGPHQTFDDVSISKMIPIHERFKFTFQAELLNAFNHPVFGAPGSAPNYYGSGNVRSSSFGQGSVGPGYNPRNIEFRANFEF